MKYSTLFFLLLLLSAISVAGIEAKNTELTASAPAKPTPAQSDSAKSKAKRHYNTGLQPYTGKQPTPPLDLPVLQGGRINLQDLAGQVVVVHFWTTRCPPCIEEMPSLQQMYMATAPKGLEILAVDVGEKPERVREFFVDRPVTFPVLLDRQRTTRKPWGVRVFPASLLVDKQQKIRYVAFGALEWTSPEVMQVLTKLLNEA